MKQASKFFVLIALVLAAPMASAQGSGRQWFQVATSVYQGGTVRQNIAFAAEVETRNIALVVPMQCAPRALASRALILDGFNNWTRSVDLRFVRQEYVGGFLRAFYTVDSQFDGSIPLVSGLVFSFAQVNPGFQQPCQITIYAHPGAI